MTTRKPGRRDPLETAIEVALQPGRFIAYRTGSDFVSSLEGVAGQLEGLVRTDARRAVGLYETFLAGCYEKAEELDDSSGNLSTLVVSLYCGWIRARQAASADADETARLLLGRMENDPYGFASTLERDAVRAMSKDRSHRLRATGEDPLRDEGCCRAGSRSLAPARSRVLAPPLGRDPTRNLHAAARCASLRRSVRTDAALGPGLPRGRRHAQDATPP